MSLRLVAKNTLVLTFAEITIKGLAFIFNLVIARLLGASLYGEYNLINAFVAIFSFLPDLGVNLIVIRDAAAQPARRRQLIGQAVVINSVFSVFSFLLIATLFSPYAQGKASLLAAVFAAATLAITALRTVARLSFDATEAMHVSAFFTVTNTVFSVTFGLAGFILTHSLAGLFAGILLGSVLTAILEWFISIRQFSPPQISFNLKSSIQLIKQGLPLGLAAAAALLYTKVDALILGRHLTADYVGWYSAANLLIFSAIQLFSVPLMIAAYPALSRHHRSPARFRRLLVSLTVIILGWTIPFIVFTILLASPIINLTFGPNFAPAVAPLRLLVFLTPFAALSALLSKALIVIGQQQLYLAISFIGSGINLLANLWFIPRWGMAGAASAAVITHLSLLVISAYQVKKLVKL